ncbi:response regulator transcription factor [Rhodophyticola sp. CCM32]|nr:response regulator transcription factor [Rhodophyticola sp. CCM32]
MPNILIADDHDLVRDTIAAYLGQVEEFSVLTAATLDEAVKVIAGEIPIDLVILDYNMPGMNGLKGLEHITSRYPHIKVTLMSGIATPDVANEAMELGAQGFFPKSAAASSMVNAIKFILSGERYFPVGFTSEAPERQAPGGFMGLSPREMQTLEKLCQGQSNKEVARELGLQEVTVKLHVKNILAKLGVSNRTQAALMAKENGIF